MTEMVNAMDRTAYKDINANLADGTLLPTDLAWKDGMTDWVPIGQVIGVRLPRNRANPCVRFVVAIFYQGDHLESQQEPIISLKEKSKYHETLEKKSEYDESFEVKKVSIIRTLQIVMAGRIISRWRCPPRSIT